MFIFYDFYSNDDPDITRGVVRHFFEKGNLPSESSLTSQRCNPDIRVYLFRMVSDPNRFPRASFLLFKKVKSRVGSKYSFLFI